jgi:type IV secretory pathway VirB10-like protein
MSLRRTTSNITRLELRVQEVEVENARLNAVVAALSRGEAGVTAPSVSGSAMEAAVTMSELLQREERPHPTLEPRKKPKAPRRSKKGYLRGVPAGSLLTQPQIVQGLVAQESKERERQEKKAAAKNETQELMKRTREEAAAAKKRKKADGAPPSRKKREEAKEVKETAEQKEEVKERVESKRGWLWWVR